MIRILRLAATLFFAAAFTAGAQAPPAYGCDFPQSKRLDFWLGDWELSHSGGASRNRITKTLDGCVVLEQFNGAPGSKLDGTSVSTFDRATKRWKQTWVDNAGTYLDFTGGEDGGDMVFERSFERDGKRIGQRMVFREVKKDSLKWLWQQSGDEGRTWKTTWEIDYRRAK